MDEAIRPYWRQNRHPTYNGIQLCADTSLVEDTLADNGKTLHATKSRKPKLHHHRNVRSSSRLVGCLVAFSRQYMRRHRDQGLILLTKLHST